MPTYAIGDVQGCLRELVLLLEKIEFDENTDRLWFTGDLVNRGPDSLGVLRIVRNLGDSAVTVLGNHDLHLIACALGVRRPRRDTFTDVLTARDCDDLVDWLRRRPLLHRRGNRILVHAGLDPEWTPLAAERRAADAEAALRGDDAPELLRLYRRDVPAESGAPLSETAETLRWLTRVRCVRRDGTMAEDFSGPPDEAPRGFAPWFAGDERRSRCVTVVFGHWAALDLYRTSNLLGLDTGCVWGRSLTAVRLEDGTVFSQPARR